MNAKNLRVDIFLPSMQSSGITKISAGNIHEKRAEIPASNKQTNGKRFVHQHHFHIPRKGTLPSPLQSTSSSRPISSNKVFCSQKIIKICHIWIPVTAFELPAAPIKSIHESIMKPIQSEYPKRLIRNNQVHPFCFRLSFKLDASLECRQTASQSRHSTQLTCCCILHLPNISIANLLFLGTIHSIARRSSRRHDLPNSELFSQAQFSHITALIRHIQL